MKVFSLAAACLLIGGCATQSPPPSHPSANAYQSGVSYFLRSTEPMLPLSNYAQRLVQRMQNNMNGLGGESHVAVASFVFAEENLQKTNAFGLAMSEHLVHQLHDLGARVVEFKATDYVRVTAEGDFVLTRDFLELQNAAKIDFVLTGTLIRHSDGVTVNARLINMQTKVIAGTSEVFVPQENVDDILKREKRDGIYMEAN